MRKSTLLALVFSFFALASIHSPVLAVTESTGAATFRTKAEVQEIYKLRSSSIEAKLRATKTEMEKKRLELKENLKKISDTRKQTAVENIDKKIEERNSHWVTHWNNVLTRLLAVVTKIEAKSAELASNGKDVSSITTAVTKAKTDITAAQQAVLTQSGKTYTLTIGSEETLGSNVRKVVTQFHTDVKLVIELINTARKSVSDALRVMKSVAGTTN